MNWKDILKHSMVLYAFTLIFGIIWLNPGRRIATVIVSGPAFSMNLLWIPFFVILILIPLIYSIKIKKELNELLLIALFFVVISAVISLPLMTYLGSLISKEKIASSTLINIREIFGQNPQSVIANPICLPLYVKNNNATCPLDRFGTIVGILSISIMAFAIITISMASKNIWNMIRKKKESAQNN